MTTSTNIENYNECLDCADFERKIDRMNARQSADDRVMQELSSKMEQVSIFCEEAQTPYDPSGPTEEWQAGYRVALQKVLDVLKSK